MQHREHVAEIDRDRRLAREQRVDALLQLGIHAVDVVVEGDHLVGELDVALGEGVDAAAQRAEHELALQAERLLQLLDSLLQ